MQLNSELATAPLRVHGDRSVVIEVDHTRLALIVEEARSVAAYIGFAAHLGRKVMPWPDITIGEVPAAKSRASTGARCRPGRVHSVPSPLCRQHSE